jgi:hypothetical protein
MNKQFLVHWITKNEVLSKFNIIRIVELDGMQFEFNA